MVVNDLTGKEVMIVGFGGITILTLVILSSIYVGHTLTQVTPVHVSAAAPKIEVNVPQTPVPHIEVTSAAPNVNVHVPQNPAPIVNVTTPPAIVTVLDKRADAEKKAEPEKEKVKTATPLLQPATAPAVIPESNKSSDNRDVAKENKELTFDTLYLQAERYVVSYCKKNNLDPDQEARKWLTKWNGQVETAIKDGMANDEQSYINRVVVDKRDCFELDKASPEKVVEGCRLMLRYRDAKLTWLQAMKNAATSENMQKTMAFLAAGVQ